MGPLEPLEHFRRLIQLRPRPNIARVYNLTIAVHELNMKYMVQPNLITEQDVNSLMEHLCELNSLVLKETQNENDKMQNM